MDLVWEYEATFGPVDDISWPKFLAGVVATARFTARQLYAAIVGPSFALAGLTGDESVGERMQVHDHLRQVAFGIVRASAEPKRLIVGLDEA